MRKIVIHTLRNVTPPNTNATVLTPNDDSTTCAMELLISFAYLKKFTYQELVRFFIKIIFINTKTQRTRDLDYVTLYVFIRKGKINSSPYDNFLIIRSH